MLLPTLLHSSTLRCRSKGNTSLRFAQWIPGGLQLAGAEPKLCVWRNDSRVWLEWDGALWMQNGVFLPFSARAKSLTLHGEPGFFGALTMIFVGGHPT